MLQQPIKRPRVLSGIQPTGVFTLGNYIGALRNWVPMQEEYDCGYMIADLHALTKRQDPAALKMQTISSIAILLACGVDSNKSLVFVQSHVPAHTMLGWILSCYTQLGELSRMTQFKDKSAKQDKNINVGLLTYPTLMAADILLYQADYVPVGADQKQHLELTRDVALRFNNVYGETFRVPEPYIPKIGSKVMSLADPSKKMSKSDTNQNSFISILDKPEVIVKKCKRAVTDSESVVRFNDQKPGIQNLMTIYGIATGQSFAQIEQTFEGKGYGDFKTAVGEAVAEMLLPIQTRYEHLMKDKSQIEQICQEGARRAEVVAEETLQKVKKKVGLLG